MIGRIELNDRVREWGLREDVVEKDYIIGWLLWGIGSSQSLSTSWAFKGGTCLKKCYLETYRFSEDLDFTVLPGGLIGPEEVNTALQNVFQRVYDQAGIDFRERSPVVRPRPDGNSVEGRVSKSTLPPLSTLSARLCLNQYHTHIQTSFHLPQLFDATVLRSCSPKSSGLWVSGVAPETFMTLLTCFVEKNSAHIPD